MRSSNPGRADCSSQLEFDFHNSRRVVVKFDAPNTSNDGCVVLIRQIDENTGICSATASLLPDNRDQHRVEHSRVEQLRQRFFQIVHGYEDQNDDDRLRNDPVLKSLTS